MTQWPEKDLEEMGLYETFEKAAFLAGCFNHSVKIDELEGYIVTEENLRKFAKLILERNAI